MFNSTTIPTLQQVIQFTEARHGVLAGNVANWGTPGYRVRDLSVETFQNRLKEALVEEQDAVVSLSEWAAGPQDSMRQVRESMEHVLHHDGSNVSLEHQVAEISKNQYMHNVAVAIRRSQFQLLQAAVGERV